MLDINKIVQEYKEGKSIREIADIYSTYPNKISRLIKKTGTDLRSKEEAAKNAFDLGKMQSPMLGKKRTQAEKDNISTKRSKQWKDMSPEHFENFKKQAKDRWDSHTESKKEDMQKKAGAALRKASTEGSKAEKFLHKHLTRLGYDVIMHKVGLIPGEKYEIDFYLPSMMVAIEIDGPQHFLPIFGEKSLSRNIKYDAVKNGALISRGICVLRVKYMIKNSSQKIHRQLANMVVDELIKIEQKFPEPENRLIEVEITNE